MEIQKSLRWDYFHFNLKNCQLSFAWAFLFHPTNLNYSSIYLLIIHLIAIVIINLSNAFIIVINLMAVPTTSVLFYADNAFNVNYSVLVLWWIERYYYYHLWLFVCVTFALHHNEMNHINCMCIFIENTQIKVCLLRICMDVCVNTTFIQLTTTSDLWICFQFDWLFEICCVSH